MGLTHFSASTVFREENGQEIFLDWINEPGPPPSNQVIGTVIFLIRLEYHHSAIRVKHFLRKIFKPILKRNHDHFYQQLTIKLEL